MRRFESEAPESRPRLTPYELVFVEGDFESRVFPGIEKEGSMRAADAEIPERFGFLSLVGDVLREVTPEDAPPEALDEYRSLLFHAFHFWADGRRLFTFDRPAARFLVEAKPEMTGWAFNAPGRSGYVQLPANLFWSSIAPDAAPEPVDGFFYTESFDDGEADATLRRIHLLFVLGIHRTRAGFSVMRIDSGLGSGLIAELAVTRPGGDFENVLPGGEIEGLYSILTTTEALKLAARAFWYVDSFPESVTYVPAPEPAERGTEPPASRLACSSVGLFRDADE